MSDQFDNIIDKINQQFVCSVGTWTIVIPYMCTVLILGSLENARRIEDHDVSRSRVLITIFDRGGYIIYACDTQIVRGTTWISHIQTVARGAKLEKHDPPWGHG